MKIILLFKGISQSKLVIEPWGEEFTVSSEDTEVQFSDVGSEIKCIIELDFSEDGFVRIENPSGFRPKVLLDGKEDERPAFSL